MISYWTSCTYRVHLVTVRIITVLLNKLRTLMISWNYNVQITHLLWAQHNTIFALPAVSDHVLNWLFKPTFSFFFSPEVLNIISVCCLNLHHASGRLAASQFIAGVWTPATSILAHKVCLHWHNVMFGVLLWGVQRLPRYKYTL